MTSEETTGSRGGKLMYRGRIAIERTGIRSRLYRVEARQQVFGLFIPLERSNNRAAECLDPLCGACTGSQKHPSPSRSLSPERTLEKVALGEKERGGDQESVRNTGGDCCGTCFAVDLANVYGLCSDVLVEHSLPSSAVLHMFRLKFDTEGLFAKSQSLRTCDPQRYSVRISLHTLIFVDGEPVDRMVHLFQIIDGLQKFPTRRYG